MFPQTPARSDGGWLDRAHPRIQGGCTGANGQMHTPTTVPGRSAAPRSTRCRADHVTGLSYAVIVMWAFSALGGAGLSARSAAQAGLLNGTRSPCVLHTICGRPALAEVTFARKHPTGGGRMRLARFGCRWGWGTSLSSREHTRPSLTPAVSRRAGTADLRTQRPY